MATTEEILLANTIRRLHLSPSMATTIRMATWTRATAFEIAPELRRTVWALRRRGLCQYSALLGFETLTLLGEQVRTYLREHHRA